MVARVVVAAGEWRSKRVGLEGRVLYPMASRQTEPTFAARPRRAGTGIVRPLIRRAQRL
jgi:hypothetical protein